MDARELLSGLMRAIDEHRWEDLTDFLHPDFVCVYVHTGERFGREDWIRLNADYPGFERLRVEDMVGSGNRAACRCHITARGERGELHFACASFAEARGGRLVSLTEVWTDVGLEAPVGTRPAS